MIVAGFPLFVFTCGSILPVLPSFDNVLNQLCCGAISSADDCAPQKIITE